MKHGCIVLVVPTFLLAACGQTSATEDKTLPPVGIAGADQAVVHGRAITTVSTDPQSTASNLAGRLFEFLTLRSAFAIAGNTVVSYNNAPSTVFSINTTALTPGAITDGILNLGSVSIAALSDNDLKACGPNGNTKCTNAAIRVYTTGPVAGFVHTVDSYGAPVYTGTLNRTTPVGLLAVGAVPVQTLGPIPTSKHTIALADFPSPVYPVSADFSNAGAGSYSMTYVVEYVLLP